MAGRRARVPIYRPHHYLLYELTPGYRSADGRTTHNSLGFRGPEFAVPKPARLYRIVCMGESTTYGSNIPDDAQTYPARLESSLRRAFPVRDIEVINAGVGGYTSAENLLAFIFKIQPVTPDLIVFYGTHNDVHPRRWPTLSRDYREYRKMWGEPVSGRSWLRARLSSFLLRDQTLGAKVLRLRQERGGITYENLSRNPPDHYRANMRSLGLLAKGWGIRTLLVIPPYPGLEGEGDAIVATSLPARGVLEHRQVIQQIGAELSIPVHDLRLDMPSPPPSYADDDAYYSDEVHVTERGAEHMAQAIGRAIERLGLLAPTSL